MARKEVDPRQGYFFEEPPQYLEDEPSFKPFEYPVWTRNKARLVQRYLRYFVFITRHGTYIDGFAGPQEPDKLETWAAGLVFDSVPKRLRNFFLCELDSAKIPALRDLEQRSDAPFNDGLKRTVRIFHGNFNHKIHEILSSGVISEKEAAFCLLDQRTFECDWATVAQLARHKQSNKIELFYFLGTGWLHRAFSGLKHEPDERMTRWWGREDWRLLVEASARSITDTLVKRFKQELGYKYANAFPIYEQDGGTKRAMYQMIHASDHPEAPKLMARAYRHAVDPFEPPEQLAIEIGARRVLAVRPTLQRHRARDPWRESPSFCRTAQHVESKSAACLACSPAARSPRAVIARARLREHSDFDRLTRYGRLWSPLSACAVASGGGRLDEI